MIEMEGSRKYNAPSESFSVPKQTSQDAQILADFFSRDVFQSTINDPTVCHVFSQFCRAQKCSEGVDFLEKISQYNALLEESKCIVSAIEQEFLSENSPQLLCLENTVLDKLREASEYAKKTAFPDLMKLYDGAQTSMEQLLRMSVYPRFVRHQLTRSARMALSDSRSRYQGLGDCFCLTDPCKADNPILYASDGFVAVTGYQREEIIPRNCRFLQGPKTDRSATSRLKYSVQNEKETVELLLNYRKNGEPFWNLLYVAPIYDPMGRLMFFLGGQINCSTTIKAKSDVLRILSNPESSDHDNVKTTARSKRSLREFVSKAKGDTKRPAGQEVVGMEPRLLKKLERLDFRSQMERFYATYSKYFITSYPDFVVVNVSDGLLRYFESAAVMGQAWTSSNLLGANIFKSLSKCNMLGSKSSKHKITSALQTGQAHSTQLTLSESQGFMPNRICCSHWTPLKDEYKATKFVTVLLSIAPG